MAHVNFWSSLKSPKMTKNPQFWKFSRVYDFLFRRQGRFFLNLVPRVVWQDATWIRLIQLHYNEKPKKCGHNEPFIWMFSLDRKKILTSWAGSATIGDTSWARLIFQLVPSISVDRLRHKTTLGLGHRTWKCVQMSYLESKTEPSVAKTQDYKKTSTVRVGHSTYFLN